MTKFLSLIILLLSLNSHAVTTLDNVSEALLQEFYSKKQKSGDVLSIEKKDTGDVRVESLTFFLGNQVYKLVIFEDGRLTLSTGQKGDIALQEILNSTSAKTSPKQIIRLIEGFQQAVPGARGYQQDKTNAQLEEEKIKDTADTLSWNSLIQRASSGELMNMSTGSDSGLSQSISAAKMMNQCQGSAAGAKSASQNIAEALVMANFAKFKSQDEGKLARSRDFDRRGSYSFFDEMDQFSQASPERAFALLQKTKTTEYEIFQSSLKKSNVESHDPHYLAANRNFMSLLRTLGKQKTLGLMDSGMKKIVLSVEKFVQYRKMLPASSIIYDRRYDKFYVDPTLNQPSQARYLLSLVCLYESKNQDPAFIRKLKDLEKIGTMTDVEQRRLTEDLFEIYEDFLKTTSHPRFE